MSGDHRADRDSSRMYRPGPTAGTGQAPRVDKHGHEPAPGATRSDNPVRRRLDEKRRSRIPTRNGPPGRATVGGPFSAGALPVRYRAPMRRTIADMRVAFEQL